MVRSFAKYLLPYHKFTVGRYWMTDYGNAEEHPEDFQDMIKYSPLQHVRENVTNPATLIIRADPDDRVVPLHTKSLQLRFRKHK